MMTEITTRQADAIVELIASIRPDWDKRGITAALKSACEISRSPSRLAVAGVFAATNGANLTPAVIAMRGPHWDALDPSRSADAPTHGGRCDECHGFHADNAPCDPRPVDHAPHIARLRGELRPTKRYEPEVST